VTVRQQGYWGFMDLEGKLKVEPAFSKVNTFHEGLAAVRTGKGWGYIRTDGSWAIKPQFLRTYDFQDSIALVKYRYRYGFIKPDGSYLIKPIFKRAMPMIEGQAIARKNKTYGIIGQDGKWIVKPRYSRIKRVGDHYLIRRNGKMGFLNRAGEESLPPKYAYIGRADTLLGCARIKSGKGWGMIDSTRNLIVPAEYTHVSNMDQGVCLVREGLLYGAYSWEGKELLLPQYTSIRKGDTPGFLIGRTPTVKGEYRQDTITYEVPLQVAHEEPEEDAILKANMKLFDYSRVAPEAEGRIIAKASSVYDIYDSQGKLLHKGLDKVKLLDQGIFSVYDQGELYYLDAEGKRIIVGNQPPAAQK
ncbi:MAG: WG repeat-containing protein, partial [Bacteroidota bacterium]